MSESTPFLSIVVPAYRAEKFIRETIRAVERHVEKGGFEAEVIVLVQSDPADPTREVVTPLEGSYPNLRVIKVPHLFGKGWAVKRGMGEARGRYRCFIDADNGVSFEQVDGALALIDRYDIVMGSRYMAGGEAGERSLARTIMSRGGNLLFKLILGLDYADTRAPMKLYRAEVAERLFPRLRLHGFGFDTELLFLAQKYGYSVKEYPVHWRADEESTVDVRTEVIRSVLELFQIRWYWLTGKYR